MSFKIGFALPVENEKETFVKKEEKCFDTPVRKSLVDVYFPERNMTLTYFNDAFDLKEGDIVFVEGKLEGKRGNVVKVIYNFKIKPSQYKKVISVADTHVHGEFYTVGSHFVTSNELSLPYLKIKTWFAPSQEETFEVGDGDGYEFNINDLKGMKISPEKAERGYDYYMQNRVLYIELHAGHGRAFVEGSEIYEVDFRFEKGNVKNLTCSCFCIDDCKHEFAVMLELSEILKTLSDNKMNIDSDRYLACVQKRLVYEYVLGGKNVKKVVF